ncbi:MAG: right-handed parallel beta-helix repeat-containing protein [Ignavibacteriales bacterium]|nr:MAG: right-handed parallel beta-helix repeat-containing protein [Ignavibacteriales bacterium]
MKKTFYLIALIILYAINVSATNYYIDATNGNDSNNGRSPSLAWKTLQKVQTSWSTFVAGDSILFKRGEIWAPTSGGGSESLLQPNVHLTGTATNYIVFGAYGSGNLPVISCANQTNKYAIYTISSRWQYVILQDIEFRGLLSLWSYNGAMHHVKVLRCVVDGTGAVGSGIDFFRNPSNEPAPETWTFEGGGDIYDIEIGYCTVLNSDYDAIFVSASRNVWVHHNEIYNAGEDGIDLQGSNNLMEYNLVSKTNATGIKNMPHYGGGANNVIRGNLVLASGYAAGINVPNARNTKIYNNTVGYTDFSAILGWQELNPLAYTTGGTTGFNDNQIYNNIFVGIVYIYTAQNYNFTYKNGSTLTGYHQDSLWLDNEWKNNLYHNDISSRLYFRYYSGSAYWTGPNTIHYAFNSSFNALEIGNSNFSYWTNKVNVDNERSLNPQFVSNTWTQSMRKAQLIANFSLQESSPGRNSGVIIPEYLFDINGNPIPPGVTPDLGAIQHSTGAGGTPIANIKIFLEAPFLSGSMNTNLRNQGYVPLTQPYNVAPWSYSGNESVASIPAGVVDWILLEFRTGTSSSTVAARRAAFLKSDGSITDLDGSSTITLNGLAAGYYYLVIKHRNHLPIMSATPVALTESSALYDFSDSQGKAYGSNSMVSLGSGLYGLFSGDGDLNGSINVIDYGSVGNNLFQTGYRLGDIDMNGTINVLDYSKIGSNLFKSSQVPN